MVRVIIADISIMTIEELEQILPDGLHDARLCGFMRDVQAESVRLDLEIWVHDESNGGRWNRGQLVFHSVEVFAVEMPDAESSFAGSEAPWLRSLEEEPEAVPEALRERLAKESRIYSIFVLDWSSNIIVAASSMSFSFEPKVREETI